MNLENQVTCPDTSELLKRLGVEQRSAFYWFQKKGSFGWHLTGRTLPPRFLNGSELAAFTVAELGEVLGVYVNRISYYPNLKKYCYEDAKGKPRYINFDTEVEARASLVIYLKENNLI